MYILLGTVVVFLAFLFYFFAGRAPEASHITWGATFSQMQAEHLGLDWKQTYSAILQDLGVKKIKLHTQWDWIEGKKGELYFADTDWQLKEAEKNNAKIIYVVGMKTGRWPECHLPTWASTLSKQEQQDGLLNYITAVVERYKHELSIEYWQVENEPLFRFGKCLWYDRDFLRKEITLVKSLDPTRQIIISDSGELSLWIGAARMGDVVGVTMYRKVWTHIYGDIGFYWNSIFPPMSYWRKAEIVQKFFGKKVIGVELQAEPWTVKPFFNVPLSEQEKSMDLNQFKANVQFAKKTGLDAFYFWGTEWWYWMKKKQQRPEIWNEAKKLF